MPDKHGVAAYAGLLSGSSVVHSVREASARASLRWVFAFCVPEYLENISFLGNMLPTTSTYDAKMIKYLPVPDNRCDRDQSHAVRSQLFKRFERGSRSHCPLDKLRPHTTFELSLRTRVIYRGSACTHKSFPPYHVDGPETTPLCVFVSLSLPLSSLSAAKAGLASVWEHSRQNHTRFSTHPRQSNYSSHSMDLRRNELRLGECV